MRALNHPVLGNAREARMVRFYFNDKLVDAREGEPIAAALMAAGIRTLRRTRHGSSPRGVYCGIGYCYECRVTVNGVTGVRSCLTPVAEGMRVESEDGAITPLMGDDCRVDSEG